ncbi:adhesin [Actinoplanes siamensis]|uniref:Uncharacterized protein n=1 Tax=Actinoplanes siamensis TaxID=1223317 RepID=A0A919TJU9_9ACTN|nr:adhesin [Actinoplanes siamensis]GIF04719.1 hypothetical protein Asi03nite_22570 [Actinoplanes siamensis]
MSMPAYGPGNGDVAYRMQGLRHTPVETGLDAPATVGAILRLWLWAAIPAVVVWAVFAFLALLVYAASEPSLFSGSSPGDGLLSVGSLLAFIVFWVVLLSARVTEPVAEWKTLLEDRWQGADSAYAAIYGTLRRRGVPVEATAVRTRSDLLPPEAVNNRLLIADRDYRVVISVFPYGSGLYLGWNMSRTRRGVTLLGAFLKDLVNGISGRPAGPVEMLRGERVRALREAVHAAVREGAEVAGQGISVPLASTFGAEVPVQDLRGHAPAPQPPGYGPHPTAPHFGGPFPGGGPGFGAGAGPGGASPGGSVSGTPASAPPGDPFARPASAPPGDPFAGPVSGVPGFSGGPHRGDAVPGGPFERPGSDFGAPAGGHGDPYAPPGDWGVGSGGAYGRPSPRPGPAPAGPAVPESGSAPGGAAGARSGSAPDDDPPASRED